MKKGDKVVFADDDAIVLAKDPICQFTEPDQEH